MKKKQNLCKTSSLDVAQRLTKGDFTLQLIEVTSLFLLNHKVEGRGGTSIKASKKIGLHSFSHQL